MMGDDMAIRSGGMYGNPESAYTIARPIAGGGGFGGVVGAFGKAMKIGFGITNAFDNYESRKGQIDTDLATLRREKEYNVKNYKQNIADVMARNKMSFYASGLDIKSGTAQDVILGNRQAMEEDLGMMIHNYDIQEQTLKQKRKALRGNLVGDIASSVLSAF